MRRRLTTLLTLVMLLASATSATAQDAFRHPGDDLTVYLVTMGQGDAVWEQFGHNTIWIRDATTRSTISYNYGIFDAAQPGFVRRFLKGRMLYTMEAFDADAEFALYEQRNRTVWAQRLNLTAEQKHALRQFLEWNWLPENKDYLYHYYYDNCSTRVRDALDRVLDGAIHDQLAGRETGTTYRWHSLRLTGANVAVYTGLSLGLGRPTDRPIDAWEEGFLPRHLMMHLRDVRVLNADGDSVPLVAEEQTLFESTRPAEADAPPNRTFVFLLFSSALGAGVVLLARRARRRRRSAFGLAVVLSTWGVISGFFGLILAFLWIATDHNTSYNNQNLLQVNPLALLLAVAAPLAVMRWHGARASSAGAAAARRSGGIRSGGIARLAWPTAVALLALSIGGLLLSLVPGIGQVNGPIIALVLPLHVATVLSLYQSWRAEPSSREDVEMQLARQAAA